MIENQERKRVREKQNIKLKTNYRLSFGDIKQILLPNLLP